MIRSFLSFLLTFCETIFFPPPGAFRLYDVDNDGFITRDEMYNIVEAIYQMVVRIVYIFSKNKIKICTSNKKFNSFVRMNTWLCIAHEDRYRCFLYSSRVVKKCWIMRVSVLTGYIVKSSIIWFRFPRIMYHLRKKIFAKNFQSLCKDMMYLVRIHKYLEWANIQGSGRKH